MNYQNTKRFISQLGVLMSLMLIMLGCNSEDPLENGGILSSSGTQSNVVGGPVFDSEVCGKTLHAIAGKEFTFNLHVSHPDENEAVELKVASAAGLPTGATMSPELPYTDNPLTTVFTWTPAADQVGTYSIVFRAKDTADLTTECEVTISVHDPNSTMIGDFVWCDLDNDGEQDAGEPGIEGVKIRLICAGPDGVLRTGDDVVKVTFTDENGNYLFTDVTAGPCVVIADINSLPPGKGVGECRTKQSCNPTPGQIYLDADFCFKNTNAEIGDFVWCDTDDDGVQDADEPGIAGVTVNLTCAGPDGLFGTADDVIDSQETDANGHYLFTDLPPDACTVTVDPTTVGDGKLPGSNCPESVTKVLGEGESYLDADFCFIPPPPANAKIGDYVWCDLNDDGVQDPFEPGIPGVTVKLTCAGPDGVFGTGDDITDSQVTDANGEYLFTDLPAGVCEVTVDPATWPEGKEPGTNCADDYTVDLGEGESFLDADFCFIYTPADCCDDGDKPEVLTMIYTGQDCSASNHSQDDGKVECDGDPNFAATVFIRASDDGDPDDTGKVWFEGNVDLGGSFDIDAKNAGEDDLKSSTYIHIFDLNGNWLQSVEFHTSCSQPLNIGDQFGASVLVNCIPKGGVPGDGDLCDDGKPQALTMRYTGEDCSASNHTQDDGKVNCDGDPAFEATVQILATDKEDPNDTGAKVWFDGTVNLDNTFDIDATNAPGEDDLKSQTFVHIFDLGGNLLQSVEFHTSCSQPLELGNQFGSLVLEGFTPKP